MVGDPIQITTGSSMFGRGHGLAARAVHNLAVSN
jgi:hypothetical protein